MNRSSSVVSRLFLVCAVLVPFAGCGGGPDKGDQAQQDMATPAPAAEPNAADGGGHGGGGKRGPRGHITLAGNATFDGDTGLSCGAPAGLGLELNFEPEGAAKVQVKVPTFKGAGQYEATVMVGEGAAAHTGTAKIEIQSREMGKGKRTALSGTFDGTFEGGTVQGSFRRCVLRDAA